MILATTSCICYNVNTSESLVGYICLDHSSVWGSFLNATKEVEAFDSRFFSSTDTRLSARIGREGEIMEYVKQPCEKDCPNRKSGCHSTCEKYKKYNEFRRHINQERLKYNNGFYEYEGFYKT